MPRVTTRSVTPRRGRVNPRQDALERRRGERLVAGRTAPEMRLVERHRRGLERSVGRLGQRRARGRAAAARRATVTCGRNGRARARRSPRLGQRAGQRACRAAACRRRRAPRARTASTRGRRGGSARSAVAAPGPRRASAAAGDQRPPRARDVRAGRRPRKASVTCSVATGAPAPGRAGGRLRPTPTAPRAPRPGSSRRDERAARGSCLPVPSSSRRSRCMATVVVRSRTVARSPGRCTVRSSRRAVGRATHRQTIPTGFSARPAARAGDAGHRRRRRRRRTRARAPSASAAATSGETAPARAISAGSTPAAPTLASLAYTTSAAEHVGRRARRGRSAAPPAGRPCTTRRSRPSRRRAEQQRGDLLVDRRAVLGEQRARGARARRPRRRRRRPPPSASRPSRSRSRRGAGRW